MRGATFIRRGGGVSIFLNRRVEKWIETAGRGRNAIMIEKLRHYRQ